MKKNRRRWLFLLLLPAVLLIVPLAGGNASDNEEIQFTEARSGSLEERADGSGVLEGLSRVDISAERGGLIETVAVQEGDTVAVGDLLLELETTEAEANLNSSASQIQTAGINLEQAQRELNRTVELHGMDLASSEALETAEENVELCRQELYRAGASYEVAANTLSKTVYYSPVGGIVTALNVEAGEMAVEGTMNNAGTVLMTIEDMSSFLVRVTMVESEIVAVEEGMAAEVVLDALPDTVFPGTVEKVGLSATSEGGGETAAEFEVLVRLDEVSRAMRSGMSATVEIVTASASECVIVPVQSIVQRPDPADPSVEVPSVLVLRGGRIETVPVETGLSSVMEIQVTGIETGEMVVSGPVEALRTLMNGDSPAEGTCSGSEEQSGAAGPMPFGGPPPGGGHVGG